MSNISRRDFMKTVGLMAAGSLLSNFTDFSRAMAQAPVIGSRDETGNHGTGSRAKVYFTRHIDAVHLMRLYERINEGIYGKVAIKLHTGEAHGPNILPRDMVKAFQSNIPNSVIVETNTMYVGDRDTTEKHRKTIEVNGWTFCPVDIMDEDGAVMLPARNALHLPEVSMGSHILNYDSMVVARLRTLPLDARTARLANAWYTVSTNQHPPAWMTGRAAWRTGRFSWRTWRTPARLFAISSASVSCS